MGLVSDLWGVVKNQVIVNEQISGLSKQMDELATNNLNHEKRIIELEQLKPLKDEVKDLNDELIKLQITIDIYTKIHESNTKLLSKGD